MAAGAGDGPMNRRERRERNRMNTKRPDFLVEIPRDQWPPHPPTLCSAWQSNRYHVQVYQESGAVRLTICRVTINGAGRYEDGITWDELQVIKRELGYGEAWAVELFPADRDVVNVQNMRHLWIPDEPPAFGWRKG